MGKTKHSVHLEAVAEWEIEVIEVQGPESPNHVTIFPAAVVLHTVDIMQHLGDAYSTLDKFWMQDPSILGLFHSPQVSK